MSIDPKQLITEAFKAKEFSYAPYSNFNVGAALLGTNGKIYTGCNIENASFTPTNCAERTAFFKAVSEGQHTFTAIAIVGGRHADAQNECAEVLNEFCAPCGVCRQVMSEFCNPKTFKIYLAKTPDDYIEYKLEDLLPLGFTGKFIKD